MCIFHLAKLIANIVVMLQLREDVKKGVYVENLKEVEATSARDVMQQLIQVLNIISYVLVYSAFENV